MSHIILVGIVPSGMAVRVHAEEAVGTEEKQELQVLMESVGRKRGMNVLLPGTGSNPWRKRGIMHKNAASQGASRSNERENGDRMMKEDEGREQKRMMMMMRRRMRMI